MARKKKEPKVEKVFKGKEDENSELKLDTIETEDISSSGSDIDDFLGVEEEAPEDKLSEKQKNKLEKINAVKSKISKILQSSNIEIVDENFDDDYESSDKPGAISQEDFDSLKSQYGAGKDGKKAEVTLTIDDFDYTYVGQYLEEYDLMHMKNIKRVKIQRKKNPKLKKFLIAASVVLAIAGGAVAAFFVTRKTPVFLESVTLNQTSRSYYTDEEFDETGLYFIAQYSDGSTKRVKLEQTHFNSDLSTGKFERVGEDKKEIVFVNNGTAILVFSYEGFNVNYEVTVKKKTETGLKAIYTDGIFQIEAGGVLVPRDLIWVFVKYEGIGEGYMEHSANNGVSIYVDGAKCEQTADGYVVQNGTTSASQILIKYGSYELLLDNSLEMVEV